MLTRSALLLFAAVLVALALSAEIQGYGAYHVGYTHYGPVTGVQHYGYTGYHYGGYSGYGGAHYGAYGGYHYGGYYYGGYGGSAYHYGYYRRW
jgi:hypothetical protein